MLSRKLCQLLQVFRIGLGSSILKVKLIEPLCNCIEVLVYLLEVVLVVGSLCAPYCSKHEGQHPWPASVVTKLFSHNLFPNVEFGCKYSYFLTNKRVVDLKTTFCGFTMSLCKELQK